MNAAQSSAQRVAETDRADSCGDGLRNLLIDPVVVEMSRRWHALMTAATGNDAALNRKLSEAYIAQPDAMAAQGMDPAMFGYIGEAMAKAGLSLVR